MTLATAVPSRASIPYDLAAGRRLLRDVAAGLPILRGGVDLGVGPGLLILRRAPGGIRDWN